MDFRRQAASRGIKTLAVNCPTSSRNAALKPFAAVAGPALAVHPLLHPPMPPTFAETAGAIGQNGKAAFLALVKRLVQRVRGISDLLQCSGGSDHIVGAFAQARHRVFLFLSVHPCLCAVYPELCEL